MSNYTVSHGGPEELPISKEPGNMVIVNNNARVPLEDAIRRLRKKVEISGRLDDYNANRHFRTKKEKRMPRAK